MKASIQTSHTHTVGNTAKELTARAPHLDFENVQPTPFGAFERDWCALHFAFVLNDVTAADEPVVVFVGGLQVLALPEWARRQIRSDKPHAKWCRDKSL